MAVRGERESNKRRGRHRESEIVTVRQEERWKRGSGGETEWEK